MNKRALFIAACVFAVFFVLIQTGTAFSDDIDGKFKKSDAYKYNQKGVFDLNNKNFTGAIEEFKKSLERFPDYYATYSNLGYAYLYSGNAPQALDSFKKAVSLKPESPEALRGLGAAYVTLKQPDEAIKYFQKSIEIDPNTAISYLALGSIYSDQKRFPEAIAMFEKVIAKEPAYAPAYMDISLVYTMKGEPDKGYEYMKQAQKLSPNDPEINGYMRRFEEKAKNQQTPAKTNQ